MQDYDYSEIHIKITTIIVLCILQICMVTLCNKHLGEYILYIYSTWNYYMKVAMIVWQSCNYVYTCLLHVDSRLLMTTSKMTAFHCVGSILWMTKMTATLVIWWSWMKTTWYNGAVLYVGLLIMW